jgi:lysine-specific demethylase 8
VAVKGSVKEGPNHVEITRVACKTKAEFRPVAAARTPAIVSGIVQRFPACGKWSPDYFRRSFGAVKFQPTIDIPAETEHGGLKRRWSDSLRETSMARFVEMMSTSDKPCFVQFSTLGELPGAERDIDFAGLAPADAGEPRTSFWMGANTNSELRFELRDQLLCQIYGEKEVRLIAPRHSKYVSPIPGVVTRSPIDPAAPNLDAHPRFAAATVLKGTIHPGEFLFLPARYWMAARAPGACLSLTHEFGKRLSIWALLAAVRAGGLSNILTVAGDFLWLGLLGRKSSARSPDDPPFGKLLFEVVTRQRRRT